jgi:hypothetical protein
MQVERQGKLLKVKTLPYHEIDGFRQLADTVQSSCEVDANTGTGVALAVFQGIRSLEAMLVDLQ